MVGLRGQSEVVGMVAVLGGRERVDLREEHATGHNLGAILMLAPTGTVKIFFAQVERHMKPSKLVVTLNKHQLRLMYFSLFCLCANCLVSL